MPAAGEESLIYFGHECVGEAINCASLRVRLKGVAARAFNVLHERCARRKRNARQRRRFNVPELRRLARGGGRSLSGGTSRGGCLTRVRRAPERRRARAISARGILRYRCLRLRAQEEIPSGQSTQEDDDDPGNRVFEYGSYAHSVIDRWHGTHLEPRLRRTRRLCSKNLRR